jgi:hypothetical protein
MLQDTIKAWEEDEFSTDPVEFPHVMISDDVQGFYLRFHSAKRDVDASLCCITKL